MLKRSFLKRGNSQLKRTPLNRIGKIGKINLEANQKIKEIWEREGIDRCEIKLPGCLGNWTLQNCHKHKRSWYIDCPELLYSFKEVVRGCQNCHDKIEYDRVLTE